MLDFAAARRMMVDGQIRTNDVTDPRILAAFLAVPRERFVSGQDAGLAYLDCDLAVTAGPASRRLLKPMVLAKLIQAAEIAPTDRVLDVGCGTGYSAAILSALAGEVVALEEDAGLASRARESLAATGAANVEIVSGALGQGWPPRAPYDVILLNGAAEIDPDRLIAQLVPGRGRLVGIFGRRPSTKAGRYLGTEGRASMVPLFDASAPTLPGFSAAPAFVF